MAGQVKAAQQERQGMSGMERLSLRVSEMINHPIAQLQRWVLIHRCDSDGEREWEEALSQMAATNELELERTGALGRGGEDRHARCGRMGAGEGGGRGASLVRAFEVNLPDTSLNIRVLATCRISCARIGGFADLV